MLDEMEVGVAGHKVRELIENFENGLLQSEVKVLALVISLAAELHDGKDCSESHALLIEVVDKGLL